MLIVGEAGTGERSLSRYIHSLSNRASSEILFVDCSASEEQVKNEVLGHRDPETDRFIKGVLERGNGGTVVFANIDGLSEKLSKKTLPNL